MLDISPAQNSPAHPPSLILGSDRVAAIGQTGPVWQKTLQSPVACHGIGLHSGQNVRMRLLPAPADHGIVFLRTDVPDAEAAKIPACWDLVKNTVLCSQLINDSGHSVGTVEHLLAALAAMEIDNVLIAIDGPEVPIMDGSSSPFIFLLECAGQAVQNAPRRYLQILKPITVQEPNGTGTKHITALPAAQFSLDSSIEFSHPLIGRQEYGFVLSPARFKTELARARTFGFLHEVEQMRARGLSLGGSLDNAIVIGADGILNPSGLRYADEFVRHKTLDIIGDLYLAGYPILGHIDAHRSGHGLNNQLLRAIFADASAWRIITLPGIEVANDALPLAQTA
jgi:UDP-3-O-[3-hydroxymyristoyl] N-acetylglucosamine deacetylase